MTKKSLKKLRKEITDKYTGNSFSGYEHLDDGTGDYARNVPEDSEEKSEKTEKT
jgi:hypothetical protein